MEEDGFQNLVESTVKECKSDQRKAGILSILKSTKLSIKQWVGKRDHFPSVEITDLEKRIHLEEVNLQQRQGTYGWDRGSDLNNMRSELWRLYKIEEQIWFQKSRARWVEEGDRNTRFFHTCALIRRKRNSMYALNVNGGITQDPSVIKACVKDHFFGIFNSSSTLEVEDMKMNFSKISVEQSNILEKEFTEEEIWETLQSWKDWEHGVNHTFITLIPKVANIGGLDDYIPISLVGGRQILDCSLIANEGIDFWRKKGLKGCGLKWILEGLTTLWIGSILLRLWRKWVRF
ncbi:uncharacterized protein LOC120184481 [Hibiscus syriacus]|uniref:uncharacterized protein LOC120184481 n=1 Tax=Hibiscus syriacus TaxID=106335 RepID=UPI001923D8D1|nr:uncharacterized protein LOC120184481 [Hibiscus syriacus]